MKVCVGLATGGTPATWEFTHSLDTMMRYDLVRGSQYLNHHPNPIHVMSGPSLAGKRNLVVREFLDKSDADALLFIDDDQDFDPDLCERMVASFDPDERPILSALIMAERTSAQLPIGPACTIRHDGQFIIPPFIPKEQHWQVATVGTGCVLIHRRVLEALRDEYADDAFPWFKHSQHDGPDGPEEMSEDYVFSLRCAKAGFPLYVDTTIEVGHVKKRTLTRADFYAQPGVAPPEPRNVAVIPVKNNLGYTKGIVRQLREEDVDEIVVVDNGSNRDTVTWLKSAGVTLISAPGEGIHRMWNRGAGQALRGGPANIFFLNNDVRLEEGAVGVLADALRADETLVAVCPNYDGRDGEGVERLHGVCGERYDGTGGLAGFAFMVKGELFTHAGYRFPEECMWWYGDTDLCMTIDTGGGWYGMVHGTSVEHLDGGGRTGDWQSKKMQPQLAKDREAFAAKWSAA